MPEIEGKNMGKKDARHQTIMISMGKTGKQYRFQMDRVKIEQFRFRY